MKKCKNVIHGGPWKHGASTLNSTQLLTGRQCNCYKMGMMWSCPLLCTTNKARSGSINPICDVPWILLKTATPNNSFLFDTKFEASCWCFLQKSGWVLFSPLECWNVQKHTNNLLFWPGFSAKWLFITPPPPPKKKKIWRKRWLHVNLIVMLIYRYVFFLLQGPVVLIVASHEIGRKVRILTARRELWIPVSMYSTFNDKYRFKESSSIPGDLQIMK